MKRIVVGDIHGGYLALEELLGKFNFDPSVDEVHSVGDLCDGWPESKRVINFFMNTKNATAILGNHDDWFLKYARNRMRFGELPIYLHHGGVATIESFGLNAYGDQDPTVLQETDEYKYVASLPYYRIIKNANDEDELLVHAGYDPSIAIEEQSRDMLCWDRSYVSFIKENRKKPEILEQYHPDEYKTIYIGHTPTIYFNGKWTDPKKFGKTWLLDTGAAFDGKLTGIDILSGEIQQSREVRQLYPDHKGRNQMSYNHELKHHTKKNNLNE